MSSGSSRLVKNASMVLETCLAAKADETVVIVAHERLMKYARAVASAAVELGAHPVILDITEYRHGPYKQGLALEPIRLALKAADMAVCVGSCANYGTLFGEPETNDVFLTAKGRCIYLQCAKPPMEEWDIAPEQITSAWKRTYDLIEVLNSSEAVRVTSPAGTDFTFRLGPTSNATPILGIAPLYAEVAIAPEQGSESGVFVVDGPTQMGVRPPDETDREHLRIVVESGRVKEYTGDPVQVKRLEEFIASGDPIADRVDEVGIVTTLIKENDPWWSDGCHITETVHIALGNNLKRDRYVHGVRHMDGLITRPTVALDGKVIFEDGKFVDERLI